jgi:hypothetical protein
MRKLSLVFLAFVLFVEGMVITPGCANVVPPQGGPKDSVAPILIKVTPADSTRNFSGSRVNFSFDEYIDVQNIQENLIISPIPRTTPTVDFRLNTISVRLRDSLEPNTTYTINFGNAVRDINEGNIAKELTYTFSTGPYIDSLELKGKVVLAETGKVDTTLVAILHTNPGDSAVVKEKPRYVARLDGQGNFTFRNLPPSSFYLYALKDEGGTKRYFSDKQLFAFADSSVKSGIAPAEITLYAYSVKPPVATTPVPSISAGARTRLGGTNTDKRLRYQTNLVAEQQDLLGNFIIATEQPLRKFDSTKFILAADTNYTRVPDARLVIDTTRQKIALHTVWKEHTRYHLIIDKEFAEDSLGRKLLKSDTIHFSTRKLDDYGSLKLRFRNLDLAKNPVLQFAVNENIIKSFVLTGMDFSQELFLPGDYELRILYDENKNGKWDPGEFFGKHKQPERVIPLPRRITVKAGVDNEYELTL